MKSRARVLLLAAFTVVLLALPATAGAAKVPSSVPVVPGNPYYLLLKAQAEPQVTYGQKVGTCAIETETSCPAADLTGAKLNAANLAYAKLSGANLSGGELVVSLGSFLGAAGADFSKVNFIGTSLAYANLRNANLSGATMTFAGFTNADMRGAKLVGADGYFGAII
ncbi:MAG: pentapeptide repeat-containing protein, partial [Actinobacteria bacterium]|nr:pentapeptide repeat-containing protein [Actinomycetota bacterium]